MNVDWPAYYERRNAEGINYNMMMADIADYARELRGVKKGAYDMRVSAILSSILKSDKKLSYWGLVKHFYKHPEDLKLCGLKKRYCKSWYHLSITEIDPVMRQKIVAWLGRDDADGTLMMDSGGFAVSRYKRWINAKYGVQDVKEFDKMNIL